MPDSDWWETSSISEISSRRHEAIEAAKESIRVEAAQLNYEVERVTFRLVGLALLRGDVHHHGRVVATIDRNIEA